MEKQELDNYTEKTWKQRWKILWNGIKKPKDTREYKEARIELAHLGSKIASGFVCIVFLLVLLCIRNDRIENEPVSVPIEIIEVDEAIELEPPPPEIVNLDIDMPNNDIEMPGIEQVDIPIDVPTEAVSVQPALETTVLMTKSPIVMKGVRAGPGGMKGSSFGYGAGSALTTDMIGYMVDLKQGDHSNLSFRHAIKELIEANWSQEALSHYFVATNKLYLNYLLVESQPAENGPTAFKCEDQVKPKKWVAHYEGRLNPSHSGEYRFVGHFDDLLIVMVDGVPVLDAYWQNRTTYSSGGRSEITNWKPDEKNELFDKHASFSGQPLVHGDWIVLEENCNKKIELIIGEEPGGVVGGVLLLEEKYKEYEKTNTGRNVLPLFSMSRLEQFEAESINGIAQRMNFRIETNPLQIQAMNDKKDKKKDAGKPFSNADVKVILKRK